MEIEEEINGCLEKIINECGDVLRNLRGNIRAQECVKETALEILYTHFYWGCLQLSKNDISFRVGMTDINWDMDRCHLIVEVSLGFKIRKEPCVIRYIFDERLLRILDYNILERKFVW